ncbi:alkaline phosphatase family protein [Mycobacterium sp. SMC-4]|uniref:alkaline phosphatase family protein n=1 Tax=Mycobacterium sp. SMC-4 TaxID=2857059 RepID=UPI0021B4C21E|nr:alkaline phosphatase family protein [Mycobacterium sp. SMC-4]UXA18204.1 alkaline phosphatase family protein [Mycobacterium sp. SMC-4]
MKQAAVVFVILDGVGARWVRPDVMPALYELAISGAWRPDGAEAVLCSATYPNILTLVTGSPPSQHRVFANPLFGHESTAAVQVSTIFEDAPERSSEFVVGDQHLIDVAKAHTSHRHWPPEGVLPADALLDEFGYAADRAVLPHALDAVERRPDLLVVHFNGPDTASHLHGPDSAEAGQAYRATDAALAELVDALGSRWEDLVLLIASDHDQETIHDGHRIDLAGLALRRGVHAQVFHEGTAAVVLGPDADDERWLTDIPGIERSWLCEPGLRVVASEPYAWFSTADCAQRRGAHGGPRTRDQVAVASGGHPMVARIAQSWAAQRPRAQDWAGLVSAGLAQHRLE